mmetsp:Transcript_95068/g.277997  ORF Transcript_95068/g.277997 Transcript_95068/m.277997 type:complete len:203 (-) Transcript_95068:114-722(-)
MFSGVFRPSVRKCEATSTESGLCAAPSRGLGLGLAPLALCCCCRSCRLCCSSRWCLSLSSRIRCCSWSVSPQSALASFLTRSAFSFSRAMELMPAFRHSFWTVSSDTSFQRLICRILSTIELRETPSVARPAPLYSSLRSSPPILPNLSQARTTRKQAPQVVSSSSGISLSSSAGTQALVRSKSRKRLYFSSSAHPEGSSCR